MKRLQMTKSSYSGKLITFCGLDGCGKTTMINRIFNDFCSKNDIILTKQPTDNVRKSEIFRAYMDNPDHSNYEYRSLSLLAASDRLQHTNKFILPALKNGYTVISDRYFYSCLANLYARGYERDKWIYEISKAIIRPDIAFFFDLPVDMAIERVRKRPTEKERYIDVDLQYRLRKAYIDICRINGGILIHTDQDEEECYEIIKKSLKGILQL